MSFGYKEFKKNIQPSLFFYRSTVHYGLYILFIHQQLYFLLKLEKFNFTLE